MRKLDIRPRFRTDLQAKRRRHIPVDYETLHHAFAELIAGRDVPVMLSPHPLQHEWTGFREFHLEEDLLVIYKVTDSAAEIHRLGTHRELFRQPVKR